MKANVTQPGWASGREDKKNSPAEVIDSENFSGDREIGESENTIIIFMYDNGGLTT